MASTRKGMWARHRLPVRLAPLLTSFKVGGTEAQEDEETEVGTAP